MATISTSAIGLDGEPVDYDYFRYQMMFSGVSSKSVSLSSPTAIFMNIPSGERLVVEGVDLVYDPADPVGWISGTVTGLQLWTRDWTTKLADITDFSVDAADFGASLAYGWNSPSGVISLIFAGDDTLDGGDKDDSLFAGNGDDVLQGGRGNNQYNPGAGSDTIYGGKDYVAGGLDYDTLSYWDLRLPGTQGVDKGITFDLRTGTFTDPFGDTDVFSFIEGVEGTFWSDSITGNASDNQLIGFSGNDVLNGLEGDDTFEGGEGADRLSGGAGIDAVWYDAYAGRNGIKIDFAGRVVSDPWGFQDTISGIEAVRGTGNADTMIGSTANETFTGLGGNDSINGGGGIDTLNYMPDLRRGGPAGIRADLAGSTVRDGFGTVDKVSGIEIVIGTRVNDVIIGNGVNNTLSGGDGNDDLSGEGGADSLSGGNGRDTLSGGAGADVLDGGAGHDTYDVDDGLDQVIEVAGGGYDTVLTGVSLTLRASAEVEVLQTTNELSTAAINLTGSSTNNNITGNAGNNRIDGKGGADGMAGGRGNDVYVVDNAQDWVEEIAGEGADTVYAGTSYALRSTASVEVLLTIDAKATTVINLTGSAIANTVTGNAGANLINGKGGNDILTGGAGKDSFVFDTAPSASANVDTIQDFVVVDDTIRLENAIFTGLKTTGPLAKGAFQLGKLAKESDDRILYDKASGFLYYDQDGSGSAYKAVLFAKLTTKPALTNADFYVI
ncbi:calcium-binding protein [Microvirga pakistanensis]|uniref:calcium-binding protein n=1 Tax=Microvirga pakistanensis TaxID=1682650 RepID=UPI001069105D|nr:calcium-binding protein [Microvirga pakistanensis]